MIESIIHNDQQLLLSLNGSDSLYADGLMWTITSTWTWIPAALVMIYVIGKNNNVRSTLLVIGMLALTILLADSFSSGFCKPYFARPRPTQDPIIMYLVDTVNGYRGGKYGFISSHAANTFSVFIFMSLLIRHRFFTIMMLVWSLLNCYSRIYLGVHYPLDIFCGLLWGAVSGGAVYALFLYLQVKFNVTKANLISSQYTSSGYLVNDVNLLVFAVAMTYLYVAIAPCFF